VGWLERGKEFTVGECDPRVYRRLVEFLADPWQPMVCCGFHDCTICQYEPQHRGSANLFIPACSFLYACPELITHYMNAHGYAPPVEFCEAELQCPPMRSMEYLKAILANGGKTLTIVD
jgi:hypothetical protein